LEFLDMPQPTEAKIWLTLLEPSHLHKGSHLLADHLESQVACRQLDRALPNLNRLLTLQSDCPDALEKAHIKTTYNIVAMGIKARDTFGPPFHQTVEKDQDRLRPSGTITAVFCQGYMLGEWVVRTAQVRAT
jgi:GrpE